MLFCRVHERQEETAKPDVQSDTGSEENTSNHHNSIRNLLAHECGCVHVWVKFLGIDLRMMHQTSRMSPWPVLCIRFCITINTMLNSDARVNADANLMCEQGFTDIFSLKRPPSFLHPNSFEE